MVDLAPRDVPCGTCTLCCRLEPIWLYPELGDNPTALQDVARAGINPTNGRLMYVIPFKNGACTMLTPEGQCRIHDRAPVMCRAFSCMEEHSRLSRPERRRRERINPANKAIYARGHELTEGGK